MGGLLRNKIFAVTLLTVGLFLAGRLLGAGPLSQVWSLSHWSVLPNVVIATWMGGIVVLIASFLLVARSSIQPSPRLIWVLPLVILALCILFRFDSPVFNGGNLRVAQIGQAPKVILRWFELGAVGTTVLVYDILRSFDVPAMSAAWHAWVVRSLTAAAVTAAGAAMIASMLASGFWRRTWLFLVIFCGGHTLVLLGYTGVEYAFPAALTVYAAAVIFYIRRPSMPRLALVWAGAVISLLVHFSLVFVVPVALYVTARHVTQRGSSRAPAVIGVLGLVTVVTGVYVAAGGSLELQKYLLWFSGKLPFGDYGLFSGRHLSDWIQAVCLGAPLALIVPATLAVSNRQPVKQDASHALLLLAAGGLVALFVLDTPNSMLLDGPGRLSYLTPVSVLLAVLLARLPEDAVGSRTIALLAALAVAVPSSVVPVYRSLERTEQYAVPYLDKYEPYYLTASYAFRDSYFAQREFQKASDWERLLAVKSPDFYLLRGSDNLRLNGRFEEAAAEQFKIVARHPYWAEARAMLAVNLQSLGRFNQAKAQIDTCLMLEPFDMVHHQNLFAYYRDTRKYPEALRVIQVLEELAPGNVEILTDKMVVLFRIEDFVASQAISDSLHARDSLLPYPYLINGLLAERDGNAARAVRNYEKFLEIAPTLPEASQARDRLDRIKAAIKTAAPATF